MSLLSGWTSPGGNEALPEWVVDRRAIEALRSGVPNRDAVRALGCAQPAIEEKFRERLQATPALFAEAAPTKGLLVAGDFGTGKSHLLEYLRLIALEEQFVCSKVVISKETPLYDPAKVFRAAIENATVPDRRGPALAEIAGALDPRRRDYVDLYTWANGGSGLNGRFPATLYLHERAIGDPELRQRIVGFWSGAPIGAAEIRQALRAHSPGVSFPVTPIKQNELALQRFQFVTRLMIAAGYAGWVILIDEVELIGRYSAKQRARSYAELVRWAGDHPETAAPGLLAVLAITADFAPAVLDQKGDREKIPGRLRASMRLDDQALASLAERGMRWIERGGDRLRPPDRATLAATHENVRQIHAQAYQWEPPTLADREVLTTTRMREYVRRWINAWDLGRLYPGYQPDLEVQDVRTDYTESPDLERTEPEEDGP